jgi:3D-(3,5/4)-trihydroxycyclohexane-1,2-dione acylhydrolase (decyclizing)
MFEKRGWFVPRPMPDAELLKRAVSAIRSARKPLIIAGGGVIYSEATSALAQFAAQTGIAVAETQAGKGSLPWSHAQSLGAMGVTGTPGANLVARDADVVIGIGTRYSDFTTASKTAFQNAAVQFININIAEFDAFKHSAIPLAGDARVTLEHLSAALRDYRVSAEYIGQVARYREQWDTEVARLCAPAKRERVAQAEVIGVLNATLGERDVIVCAAGSLPGDLHKLWKCSDPKNYHLEYGYSCMGYEIAGALGVKMAAPDREVYALVGDGSYLMLAQEIHTAIQEGIKINIVVLDNHGFGSIGGLSEACGSGGFGTKYRKRANGKLEGEVVAVDFVANARSMGAKAVRTNSVDDLRQALADVKASLITSVVVIETDATVRVPGYESWWDVPIAEVSEMESVQAARRQYESARKRERYFMGTRERASGQAAE